MTDGFQRHDRPPPYLSIVVTTRHDDASDRSHLLERLQLFVSCLDEQCRQTGLDAEVIVVDWNRLPQQVEVAPLLRLPDPCFCTYRVIDVPPDLHVTRRHAEVLLAFPMIARNVGIRRARGQFVLTTSVDVIFSAELVGYLASRLLEPDYLYRADRHDVDPEVPREALLEARLSYCATHQRRVHARSGTFPVDPTGAIVTLGDDIVDGHSLQLGEGWHVREGDGRTGFFRWAGDQAEIIVVTSATATAAVAMEIDVEANPYDPRAWLRLEVLDRGRAISRAHVTGRVRLRVPLEPVVHDGPRKIELRVTKTSAKQRIHLPVFERRDQMSYRVQSARLSPLASDPAMVEYPLSGWTNANLESTQTVMAAAEGLAVTTDPAKWKYSMQYGVLKAPASGTYRFELCCSMLEGHVSPGVLNGARKGWLPASVTLRPEPNAMRFDISVDLERSETFWIVFYNDHPGGTGVSRFVIRGMTGSIDPRRVRKTRVSGLHISALFGGVVAAGGKMVARGRTFWRERVEGFEDSSARFFVTRLPDRMRGRLVRAAPDYRAVERAWRIADDEAKTLAPLRDLADLHRSLREHRPDNLHVNHCGDFQLMARDHWHDLRGYPELEASSHHVASLLSFTANAAGIKEQALAMPIYHLQHDVSSGPSPEEGPICRRRMAERGVPRLDSGTVSIWASHMQRLRCPIMFNGPDWGIGSLELPERTSF